MHQPKWCTQATAVNNNTAVNVVEGYVISKMTGVRGLPGKRWYCVEWAGHDDTAEKLQGTDLGSAWPSDREPAAHVEGATDVNGNVAIDVFGAGRRTSTRPATTKTRTNPGARTANKRCKSRRGTRTHQIKAKCRPTGDFVPKKARRAVVRGKTKEDAGKLDKVCIGGNELKMVSVFRHLGSMIEYDCLAVDTRPAVVRSMFNQLHPLWKSTTLSTRVKLKIFRVSVGMMARYGSEAWALNEKTLKKLRGTVVQQLPSLHHRPNPQGRGGHRQLVRHHRDHPRPEAKVPR